MKKKKIPLSDVYKLIEPGPVIMVTTSQNNKPNIMTMAWHMMVEFEPPLIACIMSSDDYSFKALTKTKQCVINIPTADLSKKVVAVGSCTGSKVDKFKKFKFTPLPAKKVEPPLIAECYANLECKVVNTKMVRSYNLFILEVVQAWVTPHKKRPKTLHHWGHGLFTADGKEIKHVFNKP